MVETKDELFGAVLQILEEAWQDRYDEPFPSIDESENLFDRGLVDSFIMIELLSYLENEFGVEVDLANFDPSQLFTLSGIYDFYLNIVASEDPSDQVKDGAR